MILQTPFYKFEHFFRNKYHMTTDGFLWTLEEQVGSSCYLPSHTDYRYVVIPESRDCILLITRNVPFIKK